MAYLSDDEYEVLDGLPEHLRQPLAELYEELDIAELENDSCVDKNTSAFVERRDPGAIARFEAMMRCIVCNRPAKNKRVFPFCSEKCSYDWEGRYDKRISTTGRPDNPAKALLWDIRAVKADESINGAERRERATMLIMQAIRNHYGSPPGEYQEKCVREVVRSCGLAAATEAAQGMLREPDGGNVHDPWGAFAGLARKIRANGTG